ncbi:uncharacterized protein [Cherax quadricarinatus]|uniref:uncharacterized protein n=1 Tax=Cherax quadricarinatus TaxID=27406 RepID=UPI00387E9C4E
MVMNTPQSSSSTKVRVFTAQRGRVTPGSKETGIQSEGALQEVYRSMYTSGRSTAGLSFEVHKREEHCRSIVRGTQTGGALQEVYRPRYQLQTTSLPNLNLSHYGHEDSYVILC